VDGFVARENVSRLRRVLEDGVAPQTRATMLKLLVEEENKLGFSRERLDRLDRHISRLREIIARHVELTDRLRSRGRPIAQAEIVHATLNDLMACYIAHRQRLEGNL